MLCGAATSALVWAPSSHTVLLFLGRAAVMASYTTLYVYTPEVVSCLCSLTCYQRAQGVLAEHSFRVPCCVVTPDMAYSLVSVDDFCLRNICCIHLWCLEEQALCGRMYVFVFHSLTSTVSTNCFQMFLCYISSMVEFLL